MTDKISFTLYAGTPNVPLTGVPIGPSDMRFIKYLDRNGSARTPPTITEIGGGQYGFTPSEADETLGVCYLIDCTAAASPRRVSGAIHKQSTPFICWHLETSAGALWSGAAPTIGRWTDFDGNARATPSLVVVGGLGYLFAVTPSDDDLAIDVSYRFDSPAGAFDEFFSGSLEGTAAEVKETIGQTVFALLIADGPTAALVGSRIYPNELPQKAELPAIVYNVISDVPESSFDGHTSTTIKAARLQLDCYARATGSTGSGAYKKAHALANCVEAVLGNVSEPDVTMFYESQRDLYDNVTQYHRVQMDFTIWR